jgi:hypothetical protein
MTQPKAFFDFGPFQLTIWPDCVWSIRTSPYAWALNLGPLSVSLRR